MTKVKSLLQRGMLLQYLLVFVTVGLVGCGGSRIVFVPESDGLIRLGPSMRGHVYYWNGSSWELSNNKVSLPEGWYAGSLDGDTQPQPAAVDN